MDTRLEPESNRSAGLTDATGIGASAAGTDVVVEDFSAWPGENRLGEYSSAGAVENGGGSGELVDGSLRLEYDDGGWFLSNVRADCSEYTHLELDVRGANGGEETDVYLEIDAVEAPLAELTDDSIGTESSTIGIDLSAAGVDRSSVRDVWLTFWDAGSGALEIDEIRFVRRDPIGVGEYEARDADGDGLYEDVDGDGETTHGDVNALFENRNADGVQDDPDAFDFDENGRFGFADVLRLLREL